MSVTETPLCGGTTAVEEDGQAGAGALPHLDPTGDLHTHGWLSPVEAGDVALYEEFMAAHLDALPADAYSCGWFYLTQAARAAGKGRGFKYLAHDGKCLITIGMHRDHYVVIRPLGQSYKVHLPYLVSHLLRVSTRPVYLKKFNEEDRQWAMTQVGATSVDATLADNLTWEADCPEDDDTYPEMLVDIDRGLAYHAPNSRLKAFRKRLNRFDRLGVDVQFEPFPRSSHDGSDDLADELRSYIRTYFQEAHGPASEHCADAYENMITVTTECAAAHRLFGFVARVKDQVVGFVLAEQVSATHAALYASIGCRERLIDGTLRYPGLTERLYVEILMRLQGAEDSQIRRLNLGGSEVQSLHRFKCKLDPQEIERPVLVVDAAQ